MNEEGVIKFSGQWIRGKPVDEAAIKELNAWRDQLYALHLLGVTSDGIGYGNISCRSEGGFIITGSGSGQLQKLSSEHYTKVIAFDVAANSVTSQGPVKASSESMTHAAIYEKDRSINAVFHVHHHLLWMHLLKSYPSTSKEIPYGTPEMAGAVMKLMDDLGSTRIFAMGGHEDGVIAFGRNAEEAGQVLLYELKTLAVDDF
jgi:L-ribulose-5-phosphate 4-epimerase